MGIYYSHGATVAVAVAVAVMSVVGTDQKGGVVWSADRYSCVYNDCLTDSTD